jgi:hypothetical protein
VEEIFLLPSGMTPWRPTPWDVHRWLGLMWAFAPLMVCVTLPWQLSKSSSSAWGLDDNKSVFHSLTFIHSGHTVEWIYPVWVTERGKVNRHVLMLSAEWRAGSISLPVGWCKTDITETFVCPSPYVSWNLAFTFSLKLLIQIDPWACDNCIMITEMADTFAEWRCPLLSLWCAYVWGLTKHCCFHVVIIKQRSKWKLITTVDCSQKKWPQRPAPGLCRWESWGSAPLPCSQTVLSLGGTMNRTNLSILSDN